MGKLKKYIPYVLVAVAVFALMLIFQPCNNINNHKDESKEVKQELEAVKQREVQANVAMVKLNKEIDQRDSIIVSLKAKKDIAETQLNHSNNTSFRLSQELRAAKISKDTVKYIEKCDSLSDEVLVLQGVIISYEDYVDTLTKIYDAQLRAKDEVIKNRTELYGQLRTSFDKVAENYNSLYADFTKERKQRKKAKTLNRIAGIVIIGLGALYITK